MKRKLAALIEDARQNETTLRRFQSLELHLLSCESLPELMQTITNSIWMEVRQDEFPESSDRQPLISSLRRNLQTEHLERLFDLANEQNSSTAAMKPIANLAAMTLKDLQKQISSVLTKADNLDAYSQAHLIDASDRIRRWMDSKVVVQAAGTGPIRIRGSAESEK
jgi:hypothetical protein